QQGMPPACAQACPTQSIQFGPLAELQKKAKTRVDVLQKQGVTKAQLYGADQSVLGGLNSFYLLVDKPETYGLPSNPKLPSRSVLPSSIAAVVTALLTGLGLLFSFRTRTTRDNPS